MESVRGLMTFTRFRTDFHASQKWLLAYIMQKSFRRRGVILNIRNATISKKNNLNCTHLLKRIEAEIEMPRIDCFV